MQGEGKRLGEVLVELGVLTSGKLEDAIALHVQDAVAQVFTWTEGSTSSRKSRTARGEVTLKLSTGELILEAVRQVRTPT